MTNAICGMICDRRRQSFFLEMPALLNDLIPADLQDVPMYDPLKSADMLSRATPNFFTKVSARYLFM